MSSGGCCGGSAACGSAPPAPASSAGATLETIIGSTVTSRDVGRISLKNALGDASLVAVYVSASWCGPCREFTPKLGAWYTSHAKARGAAVIFASLDRDEASYSAYFAKMAWPLALPLADGEAFAGRHGVRSVPTLLVFTRDGTLVTKEGVNGLLRATAGSGPPFPFVWGADRIGRAVELAGLAKAAHLNGAEAVVIGATEASGRFSVRVAGSGEVVSVKPDALLPHWSERIVGKTGTLAGLEKTPEMNGASVEVVSADRERGRVGVRFVGSADVVSVRRACFVAAA